MGRKRSSGGEVTQPTGSPYQQALSRFDADRDGLYRYLEEHRLEDPSLCLGYYLERAKRELGLNQSEVADRTGSRTEPPVAKQFLSAILAGRSGVRPETYVRIASVVGANPLEFFIASGWVDPADIAAYQVPGAEQLGSIARKLEQLEPGYRRSATALVEAVLDTVLLRQAENK